MKNVFFYFTENGELEALIALTKKHLEDDRVNIKLNNSSPIFIRWFSSNNCVIEAERERRGIELKYLVYRNSCSFDNYSVHDIFKSCMFFSFIEKTKHDYL